MDGGQGALIEQRVLASREGQVMPDIGGRFFLGKRREVIFEGYPLVKGLIDGTMSLSRRCC